MGYHRIAPGSVEPAPDRSRRAFGIGDAAGRDHVAGNRFEAAPDEEIALAYHSHDERETFLGAVGERHVETPGGTDEAPAGEFFVVAPERSPRAFPPGDAIGTVGTVTAGPGDAVQAYDP